MMLKLYGHAFSSYTWKALIPFYANDLPFAFLTVEDAANWEVVQAASPLGKFPLLADGDSLIFETTTIIEHLAQHYLPQAGLVPTDPDPAIETRKMDRVFDHYVMNVMQDTVNAYLRDASNTDQVTIASVRDRLERVYRWLDNWLATYARPHQVTLIECAAAPSLFYADWVHPIPDDFARLQNWRAHLLALPAVARCVDDARPYRANFPPGAPDRD
ncbi:MAG: glutathione S-transferase family protein [Sphingomonadales bacterium]|nr:MAG: glutathione S-transferase family protein [Sphingomonadales bacterium]